MAFGLIDQVIFYGTISISLAIGAYFGFYKKPQSADDYLLGDRKMKVIPVALSAAVSHVSGALLLGQSADVYVYGVNATWNILACLLSSVISVFLFVPVVTKLNISNSFEYLELRFDRRIKIMASCVYTMYLLLYNPVVAYVPAITYSQVTGVNPQIVAPILCVICVFYTTVGGFKAVVWTDVFQFLGIMTGIFMVIVLGVTSVGFDVIVDRAAHGHRLDLNFSFNPTLRDGFWHIIIGGTTTWIFSLSFHPVTVQRYLSLSRFSSVQRVMAIQACVIGLLIFICSVVGLIMYATYNTCDPITTGEVSRADQLLPYFVMDVGRGIPALSGVFLAGIFSASLSTLSSSFNTMAAIIYGDMLAPFLSRNFLHGKETWILKLIVVILGAVTTCFTVLIERMGGVFPLVIALLGLVYGILGGIFLLGVLFPKANSLGALLGTITSTFAIGTIAVLNHWYSLQGANEKFIKPISVEGCLVPTNVTLVRKHLEHEPFVLFRISFWYNSVMAVLVVIIVGLLVSCVTKQSTVDPSLLSPISRTDCSKRNCRQKYVAGLSQSDQTVYNFQRDV
ncbi:sodium-coupled monocarboxylate transporter 1-like [Photinus pyralis]|uniref:sodium-coupled monocarboxylate transporter 1-like n=1 Tax=Photinus pyralis TaxID=7054 RepID=UPI001266F5FE|nr:sodium-coupled monocarboxylate transporter 1-like [Photinus pyralis]